MKCKNFTRKKKNTVFFTDCCELGLDNEKHTTGEGSGSYFTRVLCGIGCSEFGDNYLIKKDAQDGKCCEELGHQCLKFGTRVTDFSLSKPQFSSDKMEGSIGTSL